MTVLQAFVLGVVQGATEFLPISSSGHLVIVPALLGWHIAPDTAFSFDVLVQMGTLIAVLAYFRNDLWQIANGVLHSLRTRRPLESSESRLGWLILLSTLPAVVLGLPLKSAIERSIQQPQAVAAFLFGTAALLWIAEKAGTRVRNMDDLRWQDALWIGFAQVLALFPGVSRSGATISGGMTRHLDRKSAARFSFLMAVPVMIAAAAVALLDFVTMPGARDMLAPMIVGFLTSAVVGYAAIRWLLAYLGEHPLTIFAWYCLIAGALVLVAL